MLCGVFGARRGSHRVSRWVSSVQKDECSLNIGHFSKVPRIFITSYSQRSEQQAVAKSEDCPKTDPVVRLRDLWSELVQ